MDFEIMPRNIYTKLTDSLRRTVKGEQKKCQEDINRLSKKIFALRRTSFQPFSSQSLS